MGQIHGNLETFAQIYRDDSLIGAPEVPQDVLFNGYLNLIYTRGNFTAGIRYESYNDALLGYPDGFQGNGIGYRFASYRYEGLEVTVGNFYEQFGYGMMLRSYEERALGFDNALDGVRLRYSPIKGLYLKGFVGRMRESFNDRTFNSEGIARGLDGEIVINEMFDSWKDKKTRIILGGGVVSKYQQDRNSNLVIPENVATYGGRATISRGKVTLTGEYVYKTPDPSADNGALFGNNPTAGIFGEDGIYKNGEAIFLSGSYSRKGFGIVLSTKYVDNMSLRLDRSQSQPFVLQMNFLPALTRQHTYNLAATLYPYNTRFLGEFANQADIMYTIPKGSVIGGKYGTTIMANFSIVQSIDTTLTNDLPDPDDVSGRELTTERNGYSASLFGWGDDPYFRDINIRIERKLSKKSKLNLEYINLFYNMEIVQGLVGKPDISAHIGVIDYLYKIKRKHAIRFEAQYMNTEEDMGDWIFGQIEYSVSPHWVVTVLDQYNSGNKDEDLRIHYPTFNLVHVNKGNRFTVAYGRQRAGIFCVGGVCRNVPASNGVSFSVTSTF